MPDPDAQQASISQHVTLSMYYSSIREKERVLRGQGPRKRNKTKNLGLQNLVGPATALTCLGSNQIAFRFS